MSDESNALPEKLREHADEEGRDDGASVSSYGYLRSDATRQLLEQAAAQIESLTRDVEKYQKRAFVTTGIIDTLRAELVAERAITDSTVSTLRSIGLSNFAKEIQGYIDTARSRGETGETK